MRLIAPGVVDLPLARAMLTEYLLQRPEIAAVRVRRAGPWRRASLAITVHAAEASLDRTIHEQVTTAIGLLQAALGTTVEATVRIAHRGATAGSRGA